jgi:uncharacterized protein (DUF433 family)
MVTSREPVQSDSEILSGTPRFSGTRVPVAALMDYLKAGDRIDDFLADFRSVTREQVVAVLERANRPPS